MMSDPTLRRYESVLYTVGLPPKVLRWGSFPAHQSHSPAFARNLKTFRHDDESRVNLVLSL